MTLINRGLDQIATTRRRFLIGAAVLIAAPTIVRASSLMDIRGVPMRSMLDFIPCDGRILAIRDYPELAQALGSRYLPETHPDRLTQWPERTHIPQVFALPVISLEEFDFGVGLAGGMKYEIDRSGELFLSMDTFVENSARSKLQGGTFTDEEVDKLLRNERVKI